MPVSQDLAPLRTVLCCVAVILAVLAEASQSTPRPPLLLGSTGYQVQMPPGDVVTSTQVTKSPLGDITTNIFTVTSTDTTWTADYTVLPRAAVAFTGREQLYNNAKGHLLRKVFGKEITFNDVIVAGTPAKELQYQTPPHDKGPSLDGRARFVLIHETLFVFDVTTPHSDQGVPADEFFASFRPTS